MTDRWSVFTAALCTLALAGCATTVPTDSLRRASETRNITFDQDFVYDISAESDLPRPEAGAVRGLLAGTYVPEFEDDRGTYYRGQGDCVIVNSNPVTAGKRFVQAGGVWIERGSTVPSFRLYRDLNVNTMVVQPFNPSSRDESCSTFKPVLSLASPSVELPPDGAPFEPGVGTALGMGVVRMIISLDKGKLLLLPQPSSGVRIDQRFSQTNR
ncbi:hypothetical protein [Rhizobacter sp. LjRoot28]|uniref:hypothetical protein n=1 Tax=Rhizobacter sp. LjRoot28 TaxID=3342309 RepID=UPI003ECD5A99